MSPPWEGDTFTYEDVTRNALQYVHDGSAAAEDSMEISVTDGVTTVTTVLRVDVSQLDTHGPQLVPGCSLAITVASKSSVTLSRQHLAYTVGFHLFVNPGNAASPPFLIPPTPLCCQCGFCVGSQVLIAAKKGITDSFIPQGFEVIPI